MTLHESQRRKMEQLIAAIRSDFQVPPNARFVIEDEKQSRSSSPVYLFRDGLAVITPLTWLMFIFNLMGFYFLGSWTPTLMTAAHVPPATAALAGMALQIGGTVGALTLRRWSCSGIVLRHRDHVRGRRPGRGLDRFRRLDLHDRAADRDLLRRLHGARHPVGHLRRRAMISSDLAARQRLGWQLGTGRLGGIVGPLLGAAFVGLPIQQLYMWSALPFAAGAVVCFIVYRFNSARLRAHPELAKAQ